MKILVIHPENCSFQAGKCSPLWSSFHGIPAHLFILYLVNSYLLDIWQIIRVRWFGKIDHVTICRFKDKLQIQYKAESFAYKTSEVGTVYLLQGQSPTIWRPFCSGASLSQTGQLHRAVLIRFNLVQMNLFKLRPSNTKVGSWILPFLISQSLQIRRQSFSCVLVHVGWIIRLRNYHFFAAASCRLTLVVGYCL